VTDFDALHSPRDRTLLARCASVLEPTIRFVSTPSASSGRRRPQCAAIMICRR